MADIPALKAAFHDGLDIHAMTASEMFGVPIEGMPSHIRRQAKAINFGVIYGISAFGLANNLRIPREDAKRFIDTYFERFPGIREYMERTIAFAKQHGHVETLFGRRIHTPEINARGPHASAAQRQAINAPIQGSAADIIRRAMIRVPDAIEGLPARMLLQVHDELLFEVEEAAVGRDGRAGPDGDGGRRAARRRPRRPAGGGRRLGGNLGRSALVRAFSRLRHDHRTRPPASADVELLARPAASEPERQAESQPREDEADRVGAAAQVRIERRREHHSERRAPARPPSPRSRPGRRRRSARARRGR